MSKKSAKIRRKSVRKGARARVPKAAASLLLPGAPHWWHCPPGLSPRRLAPRRRAERSPASLRAAAAHGDPAAGQLDAAGRARRTVAGAAAVLFVGMTGIIWAVGLFLFQAHRGGGHDDSATTLDLLQRQLLAAFAFIQRVQGGFPAPLGGLAIEQGLKGPACPLGLGKGVLGVFLGGLLVTAFMRQLGQAAMGDDLGAFVFQQGFVMGLSAFQIAGSLSGTRVARPDPAGHSCSTSYARPSCRGPEVGEAAASGLGPTTGGPECSWSTSATAAVRRVFWAQPGAVHISLLGRPKEGEDDRASRVAAWAGELPFSKVASRGREDNRASRIAGRDARS